MTKRIKEAITELQNQSTTAPPKTAGAMVSTIIHTLEQHKVELLHYSIRVSAAPGLYVVQLYDIRKANALWIGAVVR